MNKFFKRLALLLAVLMIVSMMPVQLFADNSVTGEGQSNGTGESYLTISGIKGFEGTQFASFAEAYAAIKPELEKLCAGDALGQGVADAKAFDALFTNHDEKGNATLTYTISGNVVYDETDYANLLTMGRRASHYGNDRHLINFKFVGATGKEADTLTVNSNITLPYEWWGEKTVTSISFENLTITGSAPSGLYPSQPYFDEINFKVDNCNLKGIKIYNCSNVKGTYTITNSTLDGTGAPANAYAIHLQGNETEPLTINISGNTISGYDRGINIDQKTANATISGNTISIKDAGRSCIQLSSLTSTVISNNTLELTGGNAITLHEKLLTMTTAPVITVNGNTITGNGYLIYDDANKAFTSENLKLTIGTNTVASTVDTTQGVKGSNKYDLSTVVKDALTPAYVATVNGVRYASLAEAIAAAKDGDTIYVSAGEYTTYDNASPKKSLIFVGAGAGNTIWTIGNLNNSASGEGNGDYSFDGCDTITFKDMTLKSDSKDYRGFIRINNTVVENCTLEGKTAYWGYNTATFTGCTFNAPEGDYALWDYSTKTMTFDGCKFNISGKGVNVYVEAGNVGSATRKVEAKDCTIISTKENKAFLNIKNSTQAYEVTLSGDNKVNGLGANSITGSNLYQVEATTITETDGKTVKVQEKASDGTLTTVYEVKAASTAVATVGGVEYTTLAEAIAALNSTNHTLTLIDASAWDAATPVYWQAGTQSGYAAKLTDALTAAYKANAGDITIVCRPGADVGAMTHGHVADNLTVYGNNAYISGGECDLEVDRYMYSRETGKQVATDGVYLDKEITITAYELDNLGVWGQRHTDHTINISLNDCDGKAIEGKANVQRVYISGKTGVNNITVVGCDFLTKATALYSNADGKITIDKCSFAGSQVPVNFNHKANGTQTVTVKNSTFTNCGDNDEWKQFAAPVRFVNSGSGTLTAAVDNCTFTGTVGANGDILLGDGRNGEASFNVSVTVVDTAANVQIHQPGYYGADGSTTVANCEKTTVAKSNTPTTFFTVAVAEVTFTDGTTKKYSDIAEALEAANAGDTVKLLADVTADVVINKNITLDLGGKTLTNTGAGKATISVTGGTVTVKNGTVIGGASYYNIEVTKGSNANLTLEDVTATAGNTGSSMIDNWGTMTIKSGTYTGGLNVVKSEEGSTLVINGGKFTLEYATSGYTGVIFAYGTTTITGGEFIQNLTTTGRWNHPQVILAGVVEGYTSSVIVTGGKFTNKMSGESIFRGVGKATSDNFEVSGGTFNKSISDSYCAEGFIPTKNADGTYGVKEGMYVAKVGSKKYETLADAIKLAAKGKTITLLADVTEDVVITAKKNITLDLGGKTLNGGTGNTKATITNYGTITIIDSSAEKTGTIKRDDNGTEGETSYYVIRNFGTMTIEQANIINNSGYKKTNPSGSMVGSSLICNGDDDAYSAVLNIKGGTIRQDNFIAIKNGSSATLNVTGGKITSNHSAVQNWCNANITGGELNGQLWTDSWDSNSTGNTVMGGDAKFTGEIVIDITGSIVPKFEITGGTLNVTNWGITTAAANAGAKPAVSGGKFTSAVPEEYCADGFIPTKNADGTYGVKKAMKGSKKNPYNLAELSEMNRAEYIAAQEALGGTMYVKIGDYSYGTNGVLGNGVRNDTPGQMPDHSKLNAYAENGYLGDKNDGANGKNIIFVGGSITSGVTGYTSIDNIGTSLLLAVPAYTNVTFEGVTFNNVMSFNYQLYTGPWSQLGELKFSGCTFNGIIVGAIAAQTLTFNKCIFTDYTNKDSANNSNPTWIRPAYGNWTQGDNEGQGSDFRSLTTINFTGNTVTSTRPVKFEYISQWDITSTVTATGNYFDITKQSGDTSIKNVGLYLGAHTDANEFHLVAANNTKSKNTAALYTIPSGKTSLPVDSTVKNTAGESIELTDALKWKATDAEKDKIVLKTVIAVASIGERRFATLEEAVAAVAKNGEEVTIKLLSNITAGGIDVAAGQNIVFDFDGHTYTLDGSMVGSTGTKTNGFRFLKGSTVVLKNGTLANGNGSPAKAMINSYATLKLVDFSVDARTTAVAETGSAYGYAALYISNGVTTVTGNGNYTTSDDNFVILIANVGDYTDGASLVFDENYTGTVSGRVSTGNKQNATVEIKNGKFDLKSIDVENTNTTVTISGGKFKNIEIAGKYLDNKAFDTEADADGYYTVKDHPITNMGLSIGESLTLRITVDESYKNGKLKYTYIGAKDGKVHSGIVYRAEKDKKGNWVFRISDINAQRADVIYTVQYVDESEKEVGSAKEVSILKYCEGLVEQYKNADEAVKNSVNTLVCKLLNYSAAAMDYRQGTDKDDRYNNMTWGERATALRKRAVELCGTVTDYAFEVSHEIRDYGYDDNAVGANGEKKVGIEFSDKIRLFFNINYNENYTYTYNGLKCIPEEVSSASTTHRIYVTVAPFAYDSEHCIEISDADGFVYEIAYSLDNVLEIISEKNSGTAISNLAKATYEYCRALTDFAKYFK